MFEESPAEAWRLRYGSEAPEGLPDLGATLNHRSVRKYLPLPVAESTVEGLVAAAQSAATSSHLQSWSLVSVQDPERRKLMAELCGGQQQIIDCAWFFAFVADHHRTARAAAAAEEVPDGLETIEMLLVAAIDAALAAERMSVAAERLGLGICYIGALRNKPDAVRELLNLPHLSVGLFGLCLGWPDPASPAAIKPRLNQSQIWHREEYQQQMDWTEFDERMKPFYESQGMKSEVTYSMRMARRVTLGGLSGREALQEFLERQGLNRR